MAIDPVLTASFQADAYKFMLNNLVAVRGLTVSETLETDDGKSVKRPTFPNLPTSPAPVETDQQGRAGKNYAIKDPIILSAGIERDARYDTITDGKTSRQLYNLRIFPPNTGGAFPIYYLRTATTWRTRWRHGKSEYGPTGCFVPRRSTAARFRWEALPPRRW